MLPFCRIAIRTKEDGYLDQKGLREHDRDEDEAVQNHPRIQDQGLETLPLFQCDFARLQRQFMAFDNEQDDTRDSHSADTQGINGGEDRGVGLSLVQSQNDAAQNTSEEVQEHMQQDRVFEVPGLHIEKGQKAAQQEGVEKLVKIHVEQAEH